MLRPAPPVPQQNYTCFQTEIQVHEPCQHPRVATIETNCPSNPSALWLSCRSVQVTIVTTLVIHASHHTLSAFVSCPQRPFNSVLIRESFAGADEKPDLWPFQLLLFSQPSIYIDGWLYGMRMTSVVCNVPVLSQNDSTYHHSVFTT